ncbi:DUF6471 domain-containing protein [Mesorhizobium sp. B1-1-7]|uniref:DUF6471 domain-containing protein n=1 Tax=Mesorhizobium sp. B1-1-7 TaxID=2589977 RepID=UPI001FEE15F2|nr:DUF6471 domain-containing protein [Mesorhizobium sp. B1-1-7]
MAGFTYPPKWPPTTGACHLKVELKHADLTYDDLAERLKEHGFNETKASIANKLAGATMSAHLSCGTCRH